MKQFSYKMASYKLAKATSLEQVAKIKETACTMCRYAGFCTESRCALRNDIQTAKFRIEFAEATKNAKASIVYSKTREYKKTLVGEISKIIAQAYSDKNEEQKLALDDADIMFHVKEFKTGLRILIQANLRPIAKQIADKICEYKEARK